MIEVSTQFDLGLDKIRMKDPDDSRRQRETTRVLLERLFHSDPEQRWEIQIVADEVGMGKTFVALAVAYSILLHMRGNDLEDDLRGCYQKILVVTPQNQSLFNKWTREVGEFVRRCVKPEYREEAAGWFAPRSVERMDDLARELRRRGPTGPRVIVTKMSVFSGKFTDYDLKRKLLLATLFRYWGNRFPNEARERLLKGAPDRWPRAVGAFANLSNGDYENLPFDDANDALQAIECVDKNVDDKGVSKIEKLLDLCKEISEPYVRDRKELFLKVEDALIDIYRDAAFALVRQSIPLAIVDEAHNWKNGTNGFPRFAELIAPRLRRALLLTATPFQLRPEEMLEILKIGDYLDPCPTQVASQARLERLEKHRTRVVEPVLKNAAHQSHRFAQAWGRLPAMVAPALEGVWTSSEFEQARKRLERLARLDGVVDSSQMNRIIDGAIAGQDPSVKDILRESLKLYTLNFDLSRELGRFVMRHRRPTEHRLVRVGVEFGPDSNFVRTRPDRHVLHAAPGIDVRGPGELPHYLLMRCVSEMKNGKGRSSLGSALTGCWSTLRESAEGKSLQKLLGRSSIGDTYLKLLFETITDEQDREHPKVQQLVDSVLRSWHAGEKTLIFCFRTHTAHRLHKILQERIRTEMDGRREQVLDGEKALERLRSRFSRREDSLITLGLDRVLGSLCWVGRCKGSPIEALPSHVLALQPQDLEPLARLFIRYGMDVSDEKVDRVFLHRAVEHILAQRCAGLVKKDKRLRGILEKMADESWVRAPYGLENSREQDESREDAEDATAFNERGVHTRFKVKTMTPDSQAVRELAENFAQRRERARHGRSNHSIFDAYGEGPNFWLGDNPTNQFAANQSVIETIHEHLWALTIEDGKDKPDWHSRLLTLMAMRRILLRESVLLRLLPDRTEREESGWGDLLVRSFFAPLPGQREAMADRVAAFLEDLRGASGSIYDPDGKSARYSQYEASRLRGGFVALVHGATDGATRERVFAGFNSPLLPEILICTQVGQEGIDLHRHCRHVVHYDLAWNPAVLEQRTGRVDRIGSKTFRERGLPGGENTFLEVGVPFLAGTYDERMYEELRLRAQTFEVLTGGDIGLENAEGHDDSADAEGKEMGLKFAHLPARMMADLRVKLHVWESPARGGAS